METIHFNTNDAAILYSFPKPASDLKTIVWCFTFINRTAPPAYLELVNCLTKGLKAGVIRAVGERFAVEVDWYDRIHMADATAANEIESLLEFTDWLTEIEFPAVSEATFSMTVSEYQSLLEAITELGGRRGGHES